MTTIYINFLLFSYLKEGIIQVYLSVKKKFEEKQNRIFKNGIDFLCC